MIRRIFDMAAHWRALVAEAVARYQVRRLWVPWVSQLDNTLPNDCGHACVLMLVKFDYAFNKDMASGLTVADLWNAGIAPKGYTGPRDLVRLAAHYDVELAFTDHIDENFLIKQLDACHPVIVLVDYLHLRLPRHLSTPDQGTHWLVVVGYDRKRFYVHDPLWRKQDIGGRFAEGGRWHPIARETLMEAMQATGLMWGVHVVEKPQ